MSVAKEPVLTSPSGTYLAATTPEGEAYYLFNPFGAYAFNSARFEDPGVVFTEDSYRADVAAVTELLSCAP